MRNNYRYELDVLLAKRDAARRSLIRWQRMLPGNDYDQQVVSERRTFWSGRVAALQQDIDALIEDAS